MLDSSVQALTLRSLRTRSSAGRASIYAPHSVGGLQFSSLVESMVSPVAKELTNLLNGEGISSDLARDSLRFALEAEVVTIPILNGLVCRALSFLSSYGIHITASTDRLVGRILDELHLLRGFRCLSLVSPYNSQDEAIGRSFCRVGPIANGIRRLLCLFLQSGSPRQEWHASPLLRHAKAMTGLPKARISVAIRRAGLKAASDWQREPLIFQPRPLPDSVPPPEDCDPSAWDDPLHQDNDRRSRLLDRPVPTSLDKDLALVSDGSAHPVHGCTYASEARTFGELSDYHASSHAVGMPIIGRLPLRYGYGKCTIHTAEVIGGLIGLRWRRAGSYNLLVVDRSSFFSILTRSYLSFHQRNKGTLPPSRLVFTASSLIFIVHGLPLVWPHHGFFILESIRISGTRLVPSDRNKWKRGNNSLPRSLLQSGCVWR